MVGEHARQSREDGLLAIWGIDGQQPHFDDLAVGWKLGVDVRQLLVERKRSGASPGDHADQHIAIEADRIRVLGIEAVDQPARIVRRVLRDLFDEGPVVQSVDGLDMLVQFDPKRTPRRIEWVTWDGLDGPIMTRRAVELDNELTVHAYHAHLNGAVVGFQWRW